MRATLNGTEIYFDISSGGLKVAPGELLPKPTLIALHGGLGFDHGYLRPGIDALGDEVQIVYVDMRGQGRSGRPAWETCTLEQMADDVAALCEYLGIERTLILGHSAGGFIAMHAALRHPALVAGLILCSTSPTLHPIEEIGEPAPTLASRAGPDVLATAARIFSGEVTEETSAAFFEQVVPYYAAPDHMDIPARMLSLSGKEVAMMSHFMTVLAPRYDLRPQLPAIAGPALVMVGAYDWVCPPRASRAIAAGIPDATLVEFAGAGHFVFSEEPDRFRTAVIDFLNAHALRSSL